jgi:hypothetical protein
MVYLAYIVPKVNGIIIVKPFPVQLIINHFHFIPFFMTASIRLLICLLILQISLVSHGQGLKNSHHDFSGALWSGNEYCKPCHTPHNANMEVPGSPLWNHQVTDASFQLYSSPTLNSVPGQPMGNSKLCLSCHDGTVAIDNHSGFTGGTYYVTFGNLSTNLSDDHPISFAYNAALASNDAGLYNPASASSGLGGTIEEDLLQEGNLECTSCHDPLE